MNKPMRHKLTVVLLFAATVAITTLMFIGPSANTLSYQQGRPWNYPKLTAPFDIPEYYDSISAARITDSIDQAFVPIFTVNEADDSQVARLSKALQEIDDINPAIATAIVNLTRECYETGIVDNETRERISKGKLPQINVLSGTEMKKISTDDLRSTRECYSMIDTILSAPEQQAAIDKVQIAKYLTPNYELDSARTNQLRDENYKVALAPHGIVVTGQEIIDRGDIVTPKKFVLIQTYEQMMNERHLSAVGENYTTLGRIAILALLMAVLYIFLRSFRPRTFSSIKKVILLVLCILAFAAIVYVVNRIRPSAVYVIPFALVPIIITTFTDSRTGFFTHMIVVIVCSMIAQQSPDFIVTQFMAGLVAAASVQALMRRSQLVKCAVFIFLIYSASYMAYHLIDHGNLQHIEWRMFTYFAINCIVLSFAYFGIFIIEKLFGFTSIVTLVELSDINNPLLRELSQHCPGTFQHSLQVANLAGEAAHEIGANIQLARAGALYHDIGKIENPAFFTENQTGINPHDALLPEQSAQIIINHVADGLKLAERDRLPQVIRDFITQHHGTSKAKYFYSKAVKAAPEGTEVDPERFTYPGPNPQSKEAAIVMMADACEAAAKSLVEPDEAKIRALVNKIIDGQVADGLFNEAPISFSNINKVKNCLIKRLKTIYHTRVSYPEAIQPLMTPPSESDQPEA